MSQQQQQPMVGVTDNTNNNYAVVDDNTISITFTNPTPIGLKIFVAIFVIVMIGGIKPLLMLLSRWKQRR